MISIERVFAQRLAVLALATRDRATTSSGSVNGR